MIETYDSFLDIPIAPGASFLDGDDKLVPGEFGATFDDFATFRPVMLAVAKTQVAPFFHFGHGYRGRPVVAMKYGLRAAGALWHAPGTRPTNKHGLASQHALNKFKKEHHLPRNGVYDKATHIALVPYMNKYALWLLEQERIYRSKKKPHLTREDKVRAAVLASGMFLYNHRWDIPYSQYRPWDVTRIPRVPRRLDCSGGVAWCYMNGGAPEPSGYRSWGYGNTWSQLEHARRNGKITTVAKSKVGDNFQYDGHVTWKVGVDKAGHTRVWSMGHYPLDIYYWDYRHDLIAVCEML